MFINNRIFSNKMPPKRTLEEMIKRLLEIPLPTSDIQRLHKLYLGIGSIRIKNEDEDYIDDLWRNNYSAISGMTVDVDLSKESWPNFDQPSMPLILRELAGDDDLLREAARLTLFSFWRNAKLVQRLRDAAERSIARAKELEQQVAIAAAEAMAIKSAIKQANTTITRLQNSEKTAIAQRDQWQAKARELESKLTAVTEVSATAVEAELEAAKQTIKRLRSAGRRAVAQRDQWEARAKEFEEQLANLRPKNAENDTHKFAQTKRIFAKLYHPNALVSLSPLEKVIRGELFKEFWAELERIEREH